MDEETREILQNFLEESRRALAEVEPLLIDLETAEGCDKASINKIFRLFHTLKGSSGFLGFHGVQGATHEAESILDAIRNDRLELESGLVDVLCQTLDYLTTALEQIEQSGSDEASVTESVRVISLMKPYLHGPERPPVLSAQTKSELMSRIQSAADALLALKRDPLENADLVHDATRELQEVRTVAEQLPAPATATLGTLEEALRALNKSEAASTAELIAALLKTLELLRGQIETPESPSATVSSLAPALKEAQEIAKRTRIGNLLVEQHLVTPEEIRAALKSQHAPLGELLVNTGVISDQELERTLEIQRARRAGKKVEVLPAVTRPPVRAEHLRVDVHKLDLLMDLVGELIIAETAVTQGPNSYSDQLSLKASAHLNRVTRGLQDVVMSLRMVPVEPTFRKMVRLVRDVSKRQNKRVQLTVLGEDTEVDKTVVEAIADPLLHMVRNAIDHGIESEAERISAGKPPEGKLQLEARQQGGEIQIEVRDDGRGLSRERILAKGIERGLVSADRAAVISDSEVYNLIFEPGFSTAPAVTELSGRGVGMDVVKRNIEAIKGRVDITSSPGTGTRVVLRIPLTLAIIEGMLVRVGATRFIVPMLSIVESVVIRPDDVTRLSNGHELVRIRNERLGVLRLHEIYGIPIDDLRLESGTLVVVEGGEERACLFVSELIGQRQTVIKALSGYLGNPRGLGGCTVLGDGEISLIVDVPKLLRETHSHDDPRAQRQLAKEQSAQGSAPH